MKAHKNLMIMGTASNVGKSIITTALCRILHKKDYSVCPFKSQNMALNSFITKDGLEMGRAQVVQAEACNIDPEAYMNPILLKPTTNSKSQVIVHGKVVKNMNSMEYSEKKEFLKGKVEESYNFVKNNYDISIIEGAGSCAEINLKDRDIVNMGMAEIADAPVILVADIDRGGVFASILGTLMLLEEKERERVKGVIINKFRGDVKLLEPGIKKLEEMMDKPVLGVLPYSDVDIEDEDSVTDRFKRTTEKRDISISVVRTLHMSNFTDMDILSKYPDVSLRYVNSANELGEEDIIILPGSKNTIEDLKDLKERGVAEKIIKCARKGTMIFGICGGYQMLGQRLLDPTGVESSLPEIGGMGLLDMETYMEGDKMTTQYEGAILHGEGYLEGTAGLTIKGYEIHQGRTDGDEKNIFLRGETDIKGAYRENIIGTYIHGIFDNSEFTRTLLNNVRKIKGLDALEETIDFDQYKQQEFDKLADIFAANIDMSKIYDILEI